MVSTSRIKHKKTYKEPLLARHYHPDMKNNRVMLEDRGLIKKIDFFLEISVFGDWSNPLEDSLREKFERQIKNLKIGDGRTFLKVSALRQRQ